MINPFPENHHRLVGEANDFIETKGDQNHCPQVLLHFFDRHARNVPLPNCERKGIASYCQPKTAAAAIKRISAASESRKPTRGQSKDSWYSRNGLGARRDSSGGP